MSTANDPGKADPDRDILRTQIDRRLAWAMTGSFLAVTSFAVNSPELAGAMAAAGHQWATTAFPASLTLTALRPYDGLFVAAVPADCQLLIDYVLGGGNVYVAAGTGGFGSAASEAAAWNPFLEQFGLRFHDVWSTALLTAVPVSETHDVFEVVQKRSGEPARIAEDTDPRAGD